MDGKSKAPLQMKGLREVESTFEIQRKQSREFKLKKITIWRQTGAKGSEIKVTRLERQK